MTFPVKTWRNLPDVSTPIDAEALIDLETRLSGYTDTQGGIHVGASSSDPAGRTQVMSTNTITAPALRQFVFVDDAPFSAAGDAGRVFDGAMAYGSNVLTSSSFGTAVTMPPLKAGHRVEVVGAAPSGTGALTVALSTVGTTTTLNIGTSLGVALPIGTPITVFSGVNSQTFILTGGSASGDLTLTVNATANFNYPIGSSVTSTITVNIAGYVGALAPITLITSLGAPLNCTLPGGVTGATVTYGTIDTAAFQAAHDAVEAAGGGTVACLPFKSYLLSVVIPGNGGKGNVTFSGAPGQLTTIYVDTGSNTAGLPAFKYQPYGALPLGQTGASNIGFERLKFVGHGRERTFQMPIQMFMANNVRIVDCQMLNNASCAFSISDATQVKILRNYALNCATLAGGLNAFDFGSEGHGDTNPLTDVLVDGNTVYGCATESIAMVTSGSQATTTPFYARIVNNYVDCTTSKGTGIWIETGGTVTPTHPVQRVIIANNEVATVSTTAIVISNDSIPNSISPLISSYFVIQGNNISGPIGILAIASFCTIVGNNINATQAGIWATAPGGITTITAVASAGSNILTSVAATATAALSAALVISGPITTLPVTSISGANPHGISGTLPSGSTVVLTSGGHTQTWVTTADTISGTSNLPVVSQTPNFAYPIASTLALSNPGATMVVRGQQVQGTGMPPGTFLNSGVTAPTWTLSANATAGDGVTPVTFTIPTVVYGVKCSGNQIRMEQNFAYAGIRVGNCQKSSFNDNAIYCEPGSSATVSTTLSASLTSGNVIPSLSCVGLPQPAPATSTVTIQTVDMAHSQALTLSVFSPTGDASLAVTASAGQTLLANFSYTIGSTITIATPASPGIWIQTCGWLDIKLNRVDNAPQHGVYVTNSNDFTIVGNTIRNPSDVAAGSSGITFGTPQNGADNMISLNKIIDDRVSPRMLYAVSWSGSNLSFVENTTVGMTGNAVSTTTGITYLKIGQDSSGPGWWLNNTLYTGYVNFTLSSPLSTGGGAINSLPVQATGGGGIPAAIPSGTVVTTNSGLNFQQWTVTSAAIAGATSLVVAFQTPNFNYPATTTNVSPFLIVNPNTSPYSMQITLRGGTITSIQMSVNGGANYFNNMGTALQGFVLPRGAQLLVICTALPGVTFGTPLAS